MSDSPLSPCVVELEGDFTHEFIHTRGIRLHVALAGEIGAPLILLVHGWCGGWFEFKDVLAPLAARGFRVAALDLRGFGMSDKPPAGMGQDIRTLTGDISGVIQALGYDRAIVGGYDTGAALAWSTAMDKPERVAGIISIAGIYPVDMRRAIAAAPWDFLWIIGTAIWCRFPVRKVPDRFYTFELDNNTSRSFKSDFTHRYEEFRDLRHRAARIGHVYRGAIYNHRLLTAPLPLKWIDTKTRAPVLLLHADQALWGPVIKRARKRTTGTFTELNVPGTKNMPHIENPAGFITAVGTWLESVYK
ncbi:MAG: alpha/beta hydrolase [Corynebacterium sp.]|nr:alpha/beta hydrolase [Corynebacterium sp.]